MKSPNPKSNRSKKRANRGFKSLKESSRKHRRANKRMLIACTISGKLYNPGDKIPNSHGEMEFRGGGSIQFH